jgi:glycerol kinase
LSKYILSIDQGTTGTTVMVIDEQINVLTKVTREFPQIYPRPGWVEHDPEAIWGSVISAQQEALAQAAIDPRQIVGIGITNQRETSLIWERDGGKPVHHAIVWQDRRTAELCATMKQQGLQPLVQQRTGLVLDPYFSGSKICWLLDHLDGLRRRAEAGQLAFGTVDTFLIWRLTGGDRHITEVSNASRTLLFNLHTLSWDPDLLSLFQIPAALLPTVHSSAEIYGVTKGVPGLPDGIPIAGAAGDQQAALFGQACFAPGDAKCTYGTGAFLLVNTGEHPVSSSYGLITTVGWKVGQQVAYALEGSSFVAGAAVQWLRDGLGVIKSANEIEALARQVPDSGGVVFVPALAGLGAPHWRPTARGAILGLTRGTTAAHLARATLEGIALQICDLVGAMAKDLQQPLTSFKVDGGACANDLLMQIQADLLKMEIVRPEIIETTALGAAFLAGLGTGLWPDPQSILTVWKPQQRFASHLDEEQRAVHLQRWTAAVQLA